MSILLKDISDSDTILMFATDASFPEDNGVIQIDDEIITYVSNYMGTLYGCTRGVQSTSPTSHTSGTPIILLDFFFTTPAPTISFPLIAPNGDFSDPSYAFSDPTVGSYYFPNDNTIGFTVGLTIPDSYAINFGPTNGTGAEISAVGSTLLLARNGGQNGIMMGATVLIGVNLPVYNGLELDTDNTAGNTRLLLWDISAATFQRVSIGANDSGGTGFRVLCIPNA